MISKTLFSLLALGAGLASAQVRDGDSFCSISGSESCAVENISPSSLDNSVVIYPGGTTRCGFDTWSSNETEYFTNSTYFFQVFPTTNLDKKKLLIYFQGGGACLDDNTCNFGLQCGFQTFTPYARALSTGILNRSDSDNMFNDWNIVHIPYCTGDLHVGNKIYAPNDTSIDQLLGKDECLDQNMTLYMNGYNNTNSALSWALANFPNPEQLVVAGSSAGSLASQIVSVYVADMWEAEKNSIQYGVLADSYVGVQPNNTPAGEILIYYGACDVDLKFPATVANECDQSSMTIKEMMIAMFDTIPFADWLFVSSIADQTQRYFYQLSQDGVLGYPFPDLISAADFYADVLDILDAYKVASDRVSTFLIDSTQHVFLMDYFYNYSALGNHTELGPFINEWLVANSSLESSTSGSSGGTAAGSTTSEARSVRVQVSLALLAALAASFVL